MNVITEIEELLVLPGKKIGFFAGSFSPPQFAHLDFIKKVTSHNEFDHIIICIQPTIFEYEIEELKNRIRIMDLVSENTESTKISILSHDVFNGVPSQLFIDDIFYLLKRRKKEVFLLIGCDSFLKYSELFKSIDITFIIGCKLKRSDLDKQLISKNMKCLFIDDILPYSTEKVKHELLINHIYLPNNLQDYLNQNQHTESKPNCKNCN
jgi:nicotinic acid mononucleotide adenylyltransferase